MSIALTIVNGSQLVGRRAPDGSFYAVDQTYASGYVGLNHASGAINIRRIDTNTPQGFYAPSGAMNVTTDTALKTGAVIVTGDLFNPLDASPTLWLDPSDLNTLFTDTAGTTKVTANGQAVRRINNKGSAPLFYQATAAAAPLYKTDGVYHWLESDGTDDVLTATGYAMSSIIANNLYDLVVGGRFITIGTDSANGFSNDPILADTGGVFNAPFARSSGLIGAFNWDGSNDVATTAYVAAADFVWNQRHQGGSIYGQLNGGAEVSAASGNTSSVTGVPKIFDYTAGAYANARFYGAVIRNTAFTTDEKNSLRTWMASKSNVTL